MRRPASTRGTTEGRPVARSPLNSTKLEGPKTAYSGRAGVGFSTMPVAVPMELAT